MMRKVLFYIDDEIMVPTIEEKFAKYSELFSMVMARDRLSALKMVRQTVISLVVVDLDIPQLDGMNFFRQLRLEHADIPAIIFSAHPGDEMSTMATEKGAVAAISKPFKIDDLGSMIFNTLQSEADGGVMNNVSPVAFLQLIQMERKTCTITLIDNGSRKGGMLYFRDGLMVDAQAGEMRGIHAAYKVISWENVTLFIKNDCAPKKNRINKNLQAIILNAVNLKDELNENKQFTGEPDNFQEDSNVLELFEGLENIILPELTSDTPVDEEPSLKKLASLIRDQVGKRCGVEKIYHDDDMENTIQFLTELGAMFRIGPLKVGHIDQGEGCNKIIVPGSPIAVLDVSPKCPYDKLMQVLAGIE